MSQKMFSVDSIQLWNYVVAYLTLGIVLLCLALFVISRNWKSPLNRIFSAYSFSIAWWSLFTVPLITCRDSQYAYFFDQMCLLGAIFIPTAFVHFVLVFLQKADKHRKIIYSCYFISLFFIVLNISKQFVVEVKPLHVFSFYTVPSIFYNTFVLYFSTTSTVGMLLLYFSLKDPSIHSVQRSQIKWLFISSLLGYVGGGTNFLLVYGIKIPLFTPIANYAILVYGITVAYIILKYRFLDIELIIKKTLVFAGLLLFVFGIYTAAAFFIQEVATFYYKLDQNWAYIISLVFIVFGYDPIRNLLVHLTDRYLFQKKYDYQKVLKDASRGMSNIKDLEHLLGLVIHFVTMKMRVQNAMILSRKLEGPTAHYAMRAQRGYKKAFLNYQLDEQDPLVDYLTKEKEAIEIDRLDEYIAAGSKKKVKGKEPSQYDFAAIQTQLKELNGACVVPSFLGRDLRNILIIGEKKSGDYYTEEDLNVLYTLAQESAIAIENARLFDEAIKKSGELEEINKQLEFSKGRLMDALEETEKANKQLQDTQAQLIHEQKMATLGRLAASVGHEVNNPLTILSMNVSRAVLKARKDPNIKVAEIFDLFQKMDQNIGRIKAVVNTLTGLLKRSEKGKFEPLSLKLVLEETLPLIQFQTYLENLTGTEVEFDTPGSIPLIKGDLERLQEVFLNLFINAYHAMMGKRNRRILVRAEIDSGNSKMVKIRFSDNGAGMDEQLAKRIFSYGFTTKEPGKGSGMGLYMCKYIMELHGGDITVESKVGVGTTFIITIPVYDEETGTGNLRLA